MRRPSTRSSSKPSTSSRSSSPKLANIWRSQWNKRSRIMISDHTNPDARSEEIDISIARLNSHRFVFCLIGWCFGTFLYTLWFAFEGVFPESSKAILQTVETVFPASSNEILGYLFFLGPPLITFIFSFAAPIHAATKYLVFFGSLLLMHMQIVYWAFSSPDAHWVN